MLKRAIVVFLLLTPFAYPMDGNPAQLLRNAAKLYRGSHNYRLEWETKITTTTPFSSGWSKQVYVIAASDNKTHFEQQGSGVNFLRINDGESEWFLERGLRQYSIQHADPTQPHGPPVNGAAGGPTQGWINAAMRSLLHLDDEADFAELEKDELLNVNSAAVPCSVVHTLQTTSYREGVETTRESKYWVEKSSGLVRKSVTVTHGPAGFADDMDDQTKTVETLYTRLEIGNEPDASLFVFTPPSNAYLIDDARQPMTRPVNLGTFAPSLRLTDKDGKKFDLNDLKGKVVLLQFWATWCGGCLEEMKSVARLPKSYFDKGLIVVAVDEDEFPARGDNYLHSQNYAWQNLRDKGEVAKRTWGLNGYPSLALVDRDGKITWTNTGFAKNFATSIKSQLDNAKLGLAP